MSGGNIVETLLYSYFSVILSNRCHYGYLYRTRLLRDIKPERRNGELVNCKLV